MASSDWCCLTDKVSVEQRTATATGEEIAIDLDDERTVLVEITGDRDNRARVDVRLDRRWVFGVTDDVASLLFVLDEDDRPVDDELPGWIEPLLQRFGLEGVDA